MRVADGARRRVRNHSIATRTPILSIMPRNANMVTLIRASAVGSVMRARVALVMRMVVLRKNDGMTKRERPVGLSPCRIFRGLRNDRIP